MCRGKAEPLIEAVGGDTGLVRRQLYKRALSPPGFVDSPGQQRRAQATVTVGLMNPDGLDLSPQGTAAGQPRKEGQLHRGDDTGGGLGDEQQVRRVAVDDHEGRPVGGQILRAPYAVPARTKLVSGQQLHNLGNISGNGVP